MQGDHAFVDEAKTGGLVVVAVVTGPTGLGAGRAVLRGLLLPAQTHLHFTKERDNRRREIVSALVGLDIRIDVYDASGAAPAPCSGPPTQRPGAGRTRVGATGSVRGSVQ